MNVWQALALGVVQGLTEFLPISSSGHLVLTQRLFGFTEPEIFFDITVHVGTLAAVFIFFWRDVRDVAAAAFRFVGSNGKAARMAGIREDMNARLAFLIIIGSIPTAILGLSFHTVADRLFSSTLITGSMLLITGALLWMTRFMRAEGKDDIRFSVRDALVIGAVQGLAIMPGISRSGSTIAAGLFLGLKRETAARYSFMLSIPAIIAAEILSLKNIDPAAMPSMQNALLGAVTAGVVGFLALKFLIYALKQGRLHLFAPYCWIVGVIALTLGN